MAINWPDLNIPPINQQVLIPADQFYSERKPTKGIQAMKAQYKAHMGDDLLVVDSARVSFSNENWYSHNSYVYDNLSTAGYEWGRDWAMVLHCNDEFQLQVRKGIENKVAEIAIESFRKETYKGGFKQ